MSRVAPALLVNAPPRVNELPPPPAKKPPSTLITPVLVRPTPTVVTEDPLSTVKVPALLERPVSALLVVGLPLSATRDCAPSSVKLVPAPIVWMLLVPVNCNSASPVREMFPGRVDGADAATSKLAWLVVPAVVLPAMPIVPVLASPVAVTVVGATRPLIPMSKVPELLSVPPSVTVLPPSPLKVLSMPTDPVLVSPPVSVTAAAAAAPSPSSCTVPALLRLVACTVLVAASERLPMSRVAPALLVNAPPRVNELPPPPAKKPASTLITPVLVRPTPTVVTDAPFSTVKVPALLERPVSALLVVGLLLSATRDCAPSSVKLVPAPIVWMLLVPVNCNSASPVSEMVPGRVDGADAATAKLAWLVVPAVVLPMILIVPPVLDSPPAVTVVDAPSAVLPMVKWPVSSSSVPPRVTVLPPKPPNSASTLTEPVLVNAPAMVNAACAAPFFPTRLIVPALLRLVAVTVLVAPREKLPMSRVAPALLVNAPPRVSELLPPPPLKVPSTLTTPVLVRPTPTVVTEDPLSTVKVPALLDRPVSALLVVGLLLSATRDCAPSSVKLVPEPIVWMLLVPVNCNSASPVSEMVPGRVDGADAATAKLAWLVVPAVVLPMILIVPPVLDSPPAVTVVDAPSAVLPMVKWPVSSSSVPPRVTVLPPKPPNSASTLTEPVLVNAPAMVNAACAAPFFPTRLIVPALLRLVAVTVLVAPREKLPMSRVAPALLVNAPPRVSELLPPPPLKVPSTLTTPVLVRPTPIVVTDAPPSTVKVPALLDRPVSALLVVGLLLSATRDCAPSSVKLVPEPIVWMLLVPVNCNSASPVSEMVPGRVDGADAATAKLAWLVVPAVVLPMILIVPPVLDSPPAVTVVDAPSAVLPMVKWPVSSSSVPPRVTVLPPKPPNSASTLTEPVLVSAPAMVNAACAAPFFPTRLIVPALLRLVAVTVLVAPREKLPMSRVAPALLVNAPPRVSELLPPPPLKVPSTLTTPVLVRPTPTVVTEDPLSTVKVPALLDRPVSALLVVGLLLSATRDCAPSSVKLVPEPIVWMLLVPVNCNSASPVSEMVPGRVDGADAATAKLAWLVVPAVVLPMILIVPPVLDSPPAVTVVDAPSAVLPMVKWPVSSSSVPPRVTVLPPKPPNSASTLTEPVLVSAPAMVNAACAAPFFPTRLIVPALLRLVAVTVLVAPREKLPMSRVAPALLVNAPPRVSELLPPPPLKVPSTLTTPVLVRPTPTVVTEDPLSTVKVPALLDRPVSALLIVWLLLIPVNCNSASPVSEMVPGRVDGADAATAKLAWLVVPAVVLPMILIVPPVLDSPPAVTVVDAPSAVLPMVKWPVSSSSVPPRVTVLPPKPPNSASTLTEPVLVNAPAMVNAACAAPFFPTRLIVPALLRLVAVTVLVAPREKLPMSRVAPALLVNAPPRVSELLPPPPLKVPSTLTTPVLVRPTPTVVTEDPLSTVKVPALLDRPVSALLVVGLLLSATRDCAPSSVKLVPEPIVWM